MLAGDNGPTHPKVNGHVNQCSQEDKHDELNMQKESSWTALPDLILTLFPGGILLASGTTDGIYHWFLHALTNSERVYLICLLVLSAVFAAYEEVRSFGRHRVSSSLVYSSVFPFTVSIGVLQSYTKTSYTDFGFIVACINMWMSCFNPKLFDISLWTSIVALFNEMWYLPALLYLTTFESISNAAKMSFNFEEVSMISLAVTHTLLYVSEPRLLSPHEIFLPALTFGMIVAIVPAVPVLTKIRTSKNSTRFAISSYGIVVLSVLVGVRPWIAAELSEDPIIWVLKYMISSPGYELRLAIVLWWVTVLAFGIIVPVKFFTGTPGSNLHDNGDSLNKRRKFFHGIVVLLFLPSLSLDVRLLSLLSDL